MSVENIIHISLILLCYLKLTVGFQAILEIDSFELCKCAENCTMPKFESTLKHYKDISVIDSFFELTEDVPGIKISALPTRCTVREAPDTCEKNTRKNIGNTCAFLSIPATMWSPFVASFTPPFKCPFKKGKYVGINSTLAVSVAIPLRQSYYKVENDFYASDTGKYLWTLCLGFKIQNVH